MSNSTIGNIRPESKPVKQPEETHTEIDDDNVSTSSENVSAILKKREKWTSAPARAPKKERTSKYLASSTTTLPLALSAPKVRKVPSAPVPIYSVAPLPVVRTTSIVTNSAGDTMVVPYDKKSKDLSKDAYERRILARQAKRDASEAASKLASRLPLGRSVPPPVPKPDYVKIAKHSFGSFGDVRGPPPYSLGAFPSRANTATEIECKKLVTAMVEALNVSIDDWMDHSIHPRHKVTKAGRRHPVAVTRPLTSYFHDLVRKRNFLSSIDCSKNPGALYHSLLSYDQFRDVSSKQRRVDAGGGEGSFPMSFAAMNSKFVRWAVRDDVIPAKGPKRSRARKSKDALVTVDRKVIHPEYLSHDHVQKMTVPGQTYLPPTEEADDEV